MAILDWLHAGEIVALGWTLLHVCWQSALIAILYAVADRCLIRASTAARYALALGMLMLVPVCALLTFYGQQRLVVHITQDQHSVVASQLGPLHLTVANTVPFAAPAVAGGELWIASHADRLMPCIDALWLAGVCLLALRALAGWWLLKRLRRHARITVPAAVQHSFAKILAQLRLAHRVTLYVSGEVISPLAMGVWRAAVILPVSAITALPPDQLEAILAHELAHIRRWDYIANLLQTAIECLFFFHPAVWWMSRRTRDLREMCCDEVAARTCADPGVYAEALLHLEEQRAGRLQLAVALHGSGGTLLHRIRRVMGENTMDYTSISAVRLTAAALVVAGLAVAPHVAAGLKAEPPHTRILSGSGAMMQEFPEPAPAVVPLVHAAAAVHPAPTAVAVHAAAPKPTYVAVVEQPAAPQQAEHDAGNDYLERMRAAGYPLDLNKDLDTIFSLRALNVTPEYAKSIAQAGLGTPTLHDLISLKAQDVTPEYIAELRKSDLAPASFHDVLSEKALGVTPEYAKSIAALGLGTPTNHDLTSLKALGVTPEYVAELKVSGITPTDLHEVSSLRALNVTPEYAKSMAAAGYGNLSARELVSLKAQGVTPEYIHWAKANFPSADINEVRRAATFHIDDEFIAKAKAHGFNGADLDKLIRLRMTGLLN